MNYDKCGVPYIDSEELCDLLYQHPDLDFSRFYVTNPVQYHQSCAELYVDFPTLNLYNIDTSTVEAFDAKMQSQWAMPVEYQNLDIADWVLAQCNNDAELQRCGEELLLFQERDAFPLLCYMKYLVDTMRENRIVWGVGRGSSVACFVLYKIGAHTINSLYYDLDPRVCFK